MNIPLTIEVWKKGKWFIASWPELDFVSHGRTVEEAKKNIRELIDIRFEEGNLFNSRS
jgi:predicted RNase H-like HicB family nuclease